MLRREDSRALILPHNHRELVEAQIDILRGHKVELFPDFAEGGLLDVEDYHDGRGSVRLRARLRIQERRGRIAIRQVPYSLSLSQLIRSIEKAAEEQGLPIHEIREREPEQGGPLLLLEKGASATETATDLYRHSLCEIRITTRPMVLRNGRPVELPFSEILRDLTRRLEEKIEQELRRELFDLREEHQRLTLREVFVERGLYGKIATANSEEKLRQSLAEGLRPAHLCFLREIEAADLDELLGLELRLLTPTSMAKVRRQLRRLCRRIETCKANLTDVRGATIAYLRDVSRQIGKRCPRRTTVARFEATATVVPKAAFQLTAKSGDKILLASRRNTLALEANGLRLALQPGFPDLDPSHGDGPEACLPAHLRSILNLSPDAEVHCGNGAAFLESETKVVLLVRVLGQGSLADRTAQNHDQQETMTQTARTVTPQKRTSEGQSGEGASPGDSNREEMILPAGSWSLPAYLVLTRPKGLEPEAKAVDVVHAGLITASKYHVFDRLVMDLDAVVTMPSASRDAAHHRTRQVDDLAHGRARDGKARPGKNRHKEASKGKTLANPPGLRVLATQV